MISFHCAGTYIQFRTLNDIMKGVPFKDDDEVRVRYPGGDFFFAAYNGTKGKVPLNLTLTLTLNLTLTLTLTLTLNLTPKPNP